MVTSDEIRDWVSGFDPAGDARASRSRLAILALLDESAVPPPRTAFAPGHVTASAVVLSADSSRVLLVLHPRLGRWLQPGGHLEPGDATVVDAARREVLEETGVELDPRVPARLVGVDVHAIPAHGRDPAHLHHDLVFRFVAAAGAEPRVRRHQAAWYPVEALDDVGADASLRQAVVRARRMSDLNLG